MGYCCLWPDSCPLPLDTENYIKMKHKTPGNITLRHNYDKLITCVDSLCKSFDLKTFPETYSWISPPFQFSAKRTRISNKKFHINMGKGIARMYSNTHLFTSMHFAMIHPTHYFQEHKILKNFTSSPNYILQRMSHNLNLWRSNASNRYLTKFNTFLMCHQWSSSPHKRLPKQYIRIAV